MNNNLQQPVQALGVLPDGTLLAGSGSGVFMLDSSNIWANGGVGITAQPGYEISAFGYSKTARFVAFNKTKTLFRSTDNGISWNLAVNGLLNPYIKKIISSNDTIFALPSSAFYRSTDNGLSWGLARNGMPTSGISNDLLRLADGTLFIAVASGLYRSTDNASQWNPVNFFNGRSCLALTEGPDGTIFVAADTSIFSSTDHGTTWNNLGINNFLPKKILYADSSLFLLSQSVYRLKNSTVVPVNNGMSGEVINDIAAGPDGSLYASSSVKGIYRWNKQLTSWELLQTGFGASKITSVYAYLGVDYACVKGKGIFCSFDKGATWNKFSLVPKNVRSMYRFGTYVFVCDSTSLYRSTDNGSSWHSTNIVSGKGTTAIAKLGSTLYVGVQDNGVYASTDSGATWQTRNSGIEVQNVTSLINANNNALIAGAGSGLFRKPNNSNTWTSVGTAGKINTLFVANPGYLFAGSINGLYRSPDYGVTWDKMGTINGSVLSISSSAIPSLLFASSSNGTFRSTDDGISWQSQNTMVISSMIWNGNALLAASETGIAYGTITSQFSQKTKWLSVGSLQNWFADIGTEPEEYRSNLQQDGWTYPSLRPNQDMQVSKAFWIGFKDPLSLSPTKKKVIFIGPRSSNLGELIPYKFSLISKTAIPSVMDYQKNVMIDEVDSTLRGDRMIVNEIYTYSGLTIKRTIRQFSQQFHDNYLISEYTLINANSYSVDGAYLYYLYRWGLNADTRYVIGNATGWGINTLIDSRGDGLDPANTFFPGNKDNDIRAVYGWHGRYPSFTQYDNIGAPVFQGYLDKSDSSGRLGAPQFVGVAVLHADKSAKDTSDDRAQPSTIAYEDSDGPYFGMNTAVDSAAMALRYAMMTKGRAAKRHADLVGANGDPSFGTSGGYSASLGFGPYTIGAGDSVKIILAEAAAGINEETAFETGKKFKSGEITAEQKNAVVYTGRDSLFQTFRRALANYQSGYNIPLPPAPPKEFAVSLLENKIHLQWKVISEDDARLSGFEIYREEGNYFSKPEKIFSCDKSVRSWTDSTGKKGVQYFYYISSVGRSEDNTGIGQTPPGALRSSRYYTQTSYPVSMLTMIVDPTDTPRSYRLQQNYPNPFNPATTIVYQLPVSGNVTLKVFDVIGREVLVLVNDVRSAGVYSAMVDGSKLTSGVYFYRIESGNFRQTKKMILLK
ncbi:MAG: T9SS type A sorting domain-containing protein [Bacteroidota bacterium]